jgi:RPA family protein
MSYNRTMETLRQTMIKTRISDIVNGKFVKKEGMEPSYVLTGMGQKISRANVLGIIVDKFVSEDNSFSTITVDDDTDSIRVKAFREDVNMFDNLEVGDLVMVIGKVREYMEENYIIPEVTKKIANPNYELLHRLEILKQLVGQKKLMKNIKKEEEKFEDKEEFKKHVKEKYDDGVGVVETLEEEMDEKNNKSLVLEKLDELDKGKGVKFKKLLEASKLSENDFEEVINSLLSDGICYEPSPGVIKKV